MIVEYLIQFGTMIVSWFTGLFPPDPLPEFLTSLDTKINDVFSIVGGMGVWADWVYIIGVVSSVIVIWLIGLLVKFIRSFATSIPFIGGAG